MMANFLEDVRLTGIWGNRGTPSLLVFSAFMRLVQDASLDRITDIALVENFRHCNVDGTLPIGFHETTSS